MTEAQLKVILEDYQKTQKEYRDSLSKYSITVLSSELAVLGFILQNDATRHLLHKGFSRYSLVFSIGLTFASAAPHIVYKKLDALYSTHWKDQNFYQFFKDNPGLAKTYLPAHANADDLISKSAKKAIGFSMHMPKLLLLTEILLALGVTTFIAASLSLVLGIK